MNSYKCGGGVKKNIEKGGLHRDLGIAAGKKIPADRLRKAANSDDPKVRKRAQFALNARKWKH